MSTTELLAIKDKDDYFRFRGEKFERCSMSKASVFQLDEAEKLRSLGKLLQEKGIRGKIMVLRISEEEYLG